MRVEEPLRHVFTVGGLTAFSRVLGLVREMLQSRLIGAGVEQSAFTLAFALPNMARKLFGEGALTAAFVPVFKGMVARGETEEARRLARAVMTMVILILGAFVLLAVLSLTLFLSSSPSSLIPHPSSLSPRTILTAKLVRILLPYMIFICGAAFGMGVLNALGRFAEGGFMPAFLNIVWIAALGGLCFFPGMALSERVTVVCWAILLGGVAQMAFLFRCMAKRGYGFRFRFSGFGDGKFRLVWRNTAIAALGAGAVQVNYMLDQVLAQCAAPWAAGVIGYAERLMDLPLGVIGVAFGTVLLPTFSGFFARGDEGLARKALASAVRDMVFLMAPAGIGLFVLAPEVTSVIYEGQCFDGLATVRVSRALAVYALGLVFFGVQKALTPWFLAQNDMRTPLGVSVAFVFANAVLNVLAVWLLPVEWRHVGLAGSTVLCGLGGCLSLLRLARVRNGPLGLGAMGWELVRIFAAAGLMGGVLIVLRPHLAGQGRILALAVSCGAGLASYASAAVALGLRFRRR